MGADTRDSKEGTGGAPAETGSAPLVSGKATNSPQRSGAVRGTLESVQSLSIPIASFSLVLAMAVVVGATVSLFIRANDVGQELVQVRMQYAQVSREAQDLVDKGDILKQYPRFNARFLRYNLLEIVQGFRISLDPIAISETRKRLAVQQDFYADQEDDSPSEITKARARISSLKNAFALVDSLVSIMESLYLRDLVPQDSNASQEAKTKYKILTDSLVRRMERIPTIARELLYGEDSAICAWIAGMCHLLIQRYLEPRSRDRLEAAALHFQNGLKASGGKELLMACELNMRLALVHSARASLAQAEGNRIEEEKELDDALVILERERAAGHLWDESIHNNLADMIGRWVLMGAAIPKRSSPQVQSPRTLAEAETQILIAVTRNPAKLIYRTTRFELACARFGLEHDKYDSAKIRDEKYALEQHLDAVLAISKNNHTYQLLFGPASYHRKSRMMQILERLDVGEYLALKERADISRDTSRAN